MVLLLTCRVHILVNSGEYIDAVFERNVAENISRVLYPNDNVRFPIEFVNYLIGCWVGQNSIM